MTSSTSYLSLSAGTSAISATPYGQRPGSLVAAGTSQAQRCIESWSWRVLQVSNVGGRRKGIVFREPWLVVACGCRSRVSRDWFTEQLEVGRWYRWVFGLTTEPRCLDNVRDVIGLARYPHCLRELIVRDTSSKTWESTLSCCSQSKKDVREKGVVMVKCAIGGHDFWWSRLSACLLVTGSNARHHTPHD